MKTDVQQQIDDIKKIRDQTQKHKPTPNGALPEHTPPLPPSQRYTAAELERTEDVPLKWVVPLYIPEGLTVLAGKPKARKSFLMFAVANAVSTGGEVLHQKCKQKSVLYYALEDGKRRMRRRMAKISPPGWPPNLHFEHALPPLEPYGILKLRNDIATIPNLGLIVIDTLGHIRHPKKSGEDPYLYDLKFHTILHDLSQESGVDIVGITHMRKETAADTFDTITGTLGITAAADTIITMERIFKDNTETGTRLQTRGRDIDEEQDVMLDWDDHVGLHTVLGHFEADPEAKNTRQRILAELETIQYPITPKDLADQLKMSPVTVRQALRRLKNEGKVAKTTYGTYSANPRQDMSHP